MSHGARVTMGMRHHIALDGSGATRHGGVEVRCEGVVHLYRTFAGHDVVALRGLDLTIAPGERVAFLGPSGCGKSTLLTLLGGIQRPSAGRIFLGDQEISRLSERRLTRVRARLVSTMLQGATRNLLAYATARQNLAFSQLGTDPEDRDELPEPAELLERVGLADQRDQAVSTMSGGQRQRLALACAVSTGPRLLLADEPTSALGHDDRAAVVDLLHRIATDLDTTLVVVTHQAEVAASFPRTITMKNGRIGAEGRSGSEYAVLGEEGLLHLPDRAGRALARRTPRPDRGRGRRPAGDQPRGRTEPRRDAAMIALSGGRVRRRPTAALRHRPGLRARADGGPVRVERLRQDDPAVRGRRAARADARDRDVRRRADVARHRRPGAGGRVRAPGLRARAGPLRARERLGGAPRPRRAPADADARAEEALAELHIGDLGDRQVEELSGGQLQRVAVARALVVDAPVILADEPTSELDATTAGLVLRLLRAKADAGAVVVVATHDPDVAELCDDHHRFADGRLIDQPRY